MDDLSETEKIAEMGQTLTSRWLDAIDNEEDCFPEANVNKGSPAAEFAKDREAYEKSFAKAVRRLQCSL